VHMRPRRAPTPAPIMLSASMLASSLICPVPTARAQQADTLPRGQIVETVTAQSDPSQRYALYLPSRYEADSAWPVLIVMDPRGRALVPLRRIVDAAEEHGYIVVSSYHTLSDGPSEPNERAMAVLLEELPQRYALDTRRLYLVGFSGTARASWGFAPRMSGHVAGILGFGAGLPSTYYRAGAVPAGGWGFAFFGGAGTTDFNFDEVRETEEILERHGIARRLRFYDGPHAWPPAAVFAEALDWMELQAVRTGLRPASSVPIEAIYARRLGEAQELEAAERLYEAFERYRAIAEDFEGLRATEHAQTRASELEQSEPVQQTGRRLDGLARRNSDLQRRLAFVLQMIRSGSPLSLERSLEQLRVARLQGEAADADDLLGALGAQRALETYFVYSAFYEPREHLEQGEPTKALEALAIAGAVKPGHPQVCWFGAEAHLKLGHVPETLDALECLAGAGWLDPDRLESPAFDPLRGEERFQALVAGLGRGRG